MGVEMDAYVIAFVGIFFAVLGYIYSNDMKYTRAEIAELRKEVAALSTLIANNHTNILERDLVDFGYCRDVCETLEKRLRTAEIQIVALSAVIEKKGDRNA